MTMPAKRTTVADAQQQSQAIAHFVDAVAQHYAWTHANDTRAMRSGFQTFIQLTVTICAQSSAGDKPQAPEG